MVKKGQYKIQQMAFMILAIFFFFVLVGLFFVAWQRAQMISQFSILQEEKALSGLKIIADSTELNCEQSEDWCIDKDKLVAFSENSHLYSDFWSVASIELLVVYPPRGKEGELYEVLAERIKRIVDCEGSDVDNDGDGFKDRKIDAVWAGYSVTGRQGFMAHLPPNGDAKKPQLILDNINSGERIKIIDIAGKINYVGTSINCNQQFVSGEYGWVMGGFYTLEDKFISEMPIVEFSVPDGVVVPNNAAKLYVYVKESDSDRNDYADNSGSCSFSVRKLGWEKCFVYDESAARSIYSDEEREPILCPAKGCDYYVLYNDPYQKNKKLFSAYVNVCEKIDRSHEHCELAKLMLGVKINNEIN